jgi:hypothetical protein
MANNALQPTLWTARLKADVPRMKTEDNRQTE